MSRGLSRTELLRIRWYVIDWARIRLRVFFFFFLLLLLRRVCEETACMLCETLTVSLFGNTFLLSADACLNVNCNYGHCAIHQHDGTPYCQCLSGYTGDLCLEERLAIDRCE